MRVISRKSSITINSFILMMVLIYIIGCSTVEVSRVPIDLQLYKYNEVATDYRPRPTFASIDMSGDNELLHITTKDYGSSSLENTMHVYFNKKEVNNYISMIDKFLQWERVATRRGDLLEKEIGKVPSYSSDLVFDFFSGNKNEHFLSISTDAGLGDVGRLWSVYLPVNEVVKLKNILLKFKNNGFQPVDKDIYK